MNLLELFLKSGHLTVTNMALLNRYMEKWNVSAYEALLETHVMSEQVLADTLAELLKIDRIYTLGPQDISSDAFSKVSYEKATVWEILPLGTDARSKKFRVLMTDPTKKETLQELAALYPQGVDLSVSDRRFVQKYIDEFYPIEKQLPNVCGPGNA